MIKSLGNVIRTRKGLILLVAVAVACQAVFPLKTRFEAFPQFAIYIAQCAIALFYSIEKIG